MTRVPPVILALAIALTARIAVAQAKQLKPEAQAHLDAGLKAYANKQFDVAGHEFELAYHIDPDPPLLYASAQALRLGGDCTHALEIYHQFLDTHPTDAQITAAHAGIDLCAASAPPVKPEPVEPPPRTAPPVVVTEPAPRELRQEAPRWYDDYLGDALVAGGAIGIGIGIGYLVAAHASQHAADTAQFHDDFVSFLDQATTRNRVGAIAIGAGAALAVGGAIRFVLHDRGDRHAIVGGIDGHTLFVAGAF